MLGDHAAHRAADQRHPLEARASSRAATASAYASIVYGPGSRGGRPEARQVGREAPHADARQPLEAWAPSRRTTGSSRECRGRRARPPLARGNAWRGVRPGGSPTLPPGRSRGSRPATGRLPSSERSAPLLLQVHGLLGRGGQRVLRACLLQQRVLDLLLGEAVPLVVPGRLDVRRGPARCRTAGSARRGRTRPPCATLMMSGSLSSDLNAIADAVLRYQSLAV